MNTIELMLEALNIALTQADSNADARMYEKAIAAGEAELKREPDETQVLMCGNHWVHCSKEFYSLSNIKTIVRALYTREEIK